MSTRVLLVEDEPILISLYTMALSRGGYEVANAVDLTTAEQTLAAKRPHLILLDLIIPSNPNSAASATDPREPLGYRILRLVKTTPHLAGIHVVILSNLDADENIFNAKRLGADEYIVKADLNPHDLTQKITEVLRRPPRIVQLG